MSMSSLLSLLPLLGAAPQQVGGEWQTLYEFQGATSGDRLGTAVAAAGDVDGDGVPDFLVGAPDVAVGAFAKAGVLTLHSGADGSVIRLYQGPSSNSYLGGSAAGGADVDGDGVPDHMCSATINQVRSVLVFSGATGAQLHQLASGSTIASYGGELDFVDDTDGDGLADIVVSESWSPVGTLSKVGRVFQYSGATGTLIRELTGTVQWEEFGKGLAGVGDVDGDGFGDLLIGAPGATVGGVLEAGSAFVYSGATGAFIRRHDGSQEDGWFGYAVASAGDQDGDGVDDHLVGWHKHESGSFPWSAAYLGVAVIYSGADGTPLLQLNAPEERTSFGFEVVALGDADGDLVGDYAVGAPTADPIHQSQGSCFVLSGVDGGILARFDGELAGQEFGEQLAAPGDLDGDGLADLLVGSRYAQPTGLGAQGVAYVYRLDGYLSPSAEEVSMAAGGNLDWELSFPASESGVRYAVLVSLAGPGLTSVAGLEVPLAEDPLFLACASGSAPAALQGAYGTLDGNGKATATLSIGPALAPAVGMQLAFAAVTYDTGPVLGRMSSIARRIRVLP